MWKRDESVKPTVPPAQTTPATPATGPVDPRTRPGDQVTLGKSVLVKGELSGSEDLMIDGQVEGRIELLANVLTIGVNGRIRAEVSAKTVIVLGEITGNITASEKVEIRDHGSVNGDIAAPRVAIADGAHFRGSVDMKRGTSKGKAESGSPPEPPAPHAAPAVIEVGTKAGS